MNPAPVFDRVYAGIKERLLEGAMAPGTRIDPIALADGLGASMTPVRDALHRLRGEALLDGGRSEGFVVPLLTEPALRDLYAWNADLALLALRRGRDIPALPVKAGETAVDATARLFLTVARASPNSQHRYAVAVLNDRLHAIRLCEATVFEDHAAELARFFELVTQAPRTGLTRMIRQYHTRRTRMVASLVRARYR